MPFSLPIGDVPRGTYPEAASGRLGERDLRLAAETARSASSRRSGTARLPLRGSAIIDLYYPGYANPKLRPERSTDAVFSLQSDTMLGGAALTWFTRYATDLIELDSSYVPQNVAHGGISGLQASLRTHRSRSSTRSAHGGSVSARSRTSRVRTAKTASIR